MSERDETRIPGSVLSSTWLTIVGAGGLVLSTALLFTVRDTLVDAIRQGAKDRQLTDAQAGSAADSQLWVLLIVSVLLAGAQAWSTWRARSGIRRYRTIATVALVLTVLFVMFSGSLFQLIAAILLIFGLVLLYLPAANEHFRAVGAGR